MKKIKKVMATVLLLCMIGSMLVVPAAASEITASEISLNFMGKTLALGGTVQLKAIFEPEGANPTVKWESDNAAVASVDENGLVTGLANGTAVIKASVYEGQLIAECTVTVVTETDETPIVPVSGISLGEQTSLNLEPNGTAALVATVAPENATNKYVAWVSSDENVVTVDEFGVVTAHAAGFATISAIAADVDLTAEDLSMAAIANCAVTVSEPYVEPAPVLVQWISIDPASVTMNVGEGSYLSAYVNDDAANKALSWSSSDPGIVSVDNGSIYAAAPGTAYISATATDGSNVTASCTVTVNTPAPATVAVNSVVIDPAELSLDPEQTAVLNAYVNEDATDKSLTWSSSDTNIVLVDNGNIYAVAPGTAYISATANDGSGTVGYCTVTVNTPAPATVAVNSVVIDPAELSLDPEQTAVLNAYVNEDATDKSLTWSSSDTNIVLVDNGNIYAVAPGTAYISATANDGSNVTASCTVTVNTPAPAPTPTPAVVPATSVTLEPNLSELTLKVGEYADFTASVDAEATDKGLYWVSDDSAVASVDNGRVTANGSGRTTIYAVANGDTAYAACTVIVTSEPVAMFAARPNAVTDNGEGGSNNDEQQPAPADNVTPATIVLTVGGTVWAEDRKIDLSTAENGTSYALSASMSDASAATYGWTLVDGSGITLTPDTENSANCTLTVTGEGAGKIAISNGTVSRNVDFTVSAQEVTGLVSQLTLAVGEEAQLSASTKYTSGGIAWSVESGGEFVSVDDSGKVTAGSAAGNAVVRATAKDGSGVYAECAVTVETKVVNVSSVELNAERLNLKVGEKATLSANVKPGDASNKSVSWKTDSDAVATVTEGVVEAVGPGNTTITVTTADGSKTDTCIVEVTAPPTVSIVSNTTTGTELYFDINDANYTGLSARLSTGDPESGKFFTWTVTGDAGVISLSNNGSNYQNCVLDITGVGTAQIVASYEGISSQPFTVHVQKMVQTITLPDEISLKQGETYNLAAEAELTPADPASSALIWASTDGTGHISVNRDTGIITISGNAPEGQTAYISATATDPRGTTSNNCTVKVVSATIPVTNVTITRSVASLTVGNGFQFEAKVTPDNATDSTIQWTSTNPAVAEVNRNSGYVTAKGNGTAQIQASAGGKVAAVNLSVSVAPINRGELRVVASPQTISTTNGYSVLTAYVNGQVINGGVNWSVSDPNMATVSSNGVVTAKRAGSFTVTGIYDNNNTRYSGTVLITASPVITSGNYSNYDGQNIMYFKTNQTYPSWRSTDIVSVDGVVLRHGQHCYVGSSPDGYVMVALNPQYLNTLPSSVVHTIRIGPASSPAVGYFRTYTGQGTVINGVMTGDENQAALWAALCMVGILGCATILVSRRKDWNS